MRSPKCLILLAVVAWVVAAAAPGCKGKAPGQAQLPPATGPQAPPLPALPAVEEAPAPSSVGTTEGKTTGTLYPHAESQLSPKVSGTIARIPVKEGDRVHKGDVVFQLDTSENLLRRDQAVVALDAAKINLKSAQQEFDRTKALFEQGAVNQSIWDQVQSRLEAAQAGVKQAQVALSMVQKAIADASVRSPLDGVVTAKLKNEGEMVTTMPPTVVLVVQEQQTLDLRFRLPERALAAVKVGDVVNARFDAVGVSKSAKIVRIQPTVDARTRTVELVAEIPNPDLQLKPGLLAEIELTSAAAAARSGASQ